MPTHEQLFAYVQTEMRDKNGIFSNGRNLPKLVKNAGFVDVQSRKVNIEIGAWGPGSMPSGFRRSIVDPENHEFASRCVDVWTALLLTLAKGYIAKFGLDENEASAFNEAIAQEFRNLDYQLYSDGFGPLSVIDLLKDIL